MFKVGENILINKADVSSVLNDITAPHLTHDIELILNSPFRIIDIGDGAENSHRPLYYCISTLNEFKINLYHKEMTHDKIYFRKLKLKRLMDG